MERLLGDAFEAGLVLVGLACALAYTGLTLTVSVLIQRAIDGSIVPGSTGALWPYIVAIMALGLARFWVNYTRRFATSRVGIRLEGGRGHRVTTVYSVDPFGSQP